MIYDTDGLVLVGNTGGTNVGQSFYNVAIKTGFRSFLCNSHRAFEAPSWLSRFNWRMRDHRPTYLKRFSQEVLRVCEKFRPRWLLSTGIAPICSDELEVIGKLGIKRLNYLTDDPWNLSLGSKWFFKTLRLYDLIFSVRKSNLDDLRKLECKKIEYLPFGFDPQLFYKPNNNVLSDQSITRDVIFAGGADKERLPYMTSLIREGISLDLYGDYWSHYSKTKPFARGHADPDTLREVTARAKVAVCLVRRANRDGHVMRSFEIPAIGTCMLAEDTLEHREIFGEEGKAVVYFRGEKEIVEKTKWLLSHDTERYLLAKNAHDIIVNGRHTYQDRLTSILNLSL